MRRPSGQTAAVVRALACAPERWRYGYELGQDVGLKAGSLYPILMRLRDRGLLETSWEADPPGGRPARHLCRLTMDGLVFAEALADSVPQAGAAATKAFRAQVRGAW
jgi:PadR family transcriptional regulator PadR